MGARARREQGTTGYAGVLERLRQHGIVATRLSKYRLRLAQLWLDDHRCYWCGGESFWPNETGSYDHDATVEHLFARKHPRRGGPSTTVLACRRDNSLMSVVQTPLSLGGKSAERRAAVWAEIKRCFLPERYREALAITAEMDAQVYALIEREEVTR